MKEKYNKKKASVCYLDRILVCAVTQPIFCNLKDILPFPKPYAKLSTAGIHTKVSPLGPPPVSIKKSPGLWLVFFNEKFSPVTLAVDGACLHGFREKAYAKKYN